MVRPTPQQQPLVALAADHRLLLLMLVATLFMVVVVEAVPVLEAASLVPWAAAVSTVLALAAAAGLLRGARRMLGELAVLSTRMRPEAAELVVVRVLRVQQARHVVALESAGTVVVAVAQATLRLVVLAAREVTPAVVVAVAQEARLSVARAEQEQEEKLLFIHGRRNGLLHCWIARLLTMKQLNNEAMKGGDYGRSFKIRDCR